MKPFIAFSSSRNRASISKNSALIFNLYIVLFKPYLSKSSPNFVKSYPDFCRTKTAKSCHNCTKLGHDFSQIHPAILRHKQQNSTRYNFIPFNFIISNIALDTLMLVFVGIVKSHSPRYCFGTNGTEIDKHFRKDKLA